MPTTYDSLGFPVSVSPLPAQPRTPSRYDRMLLAGRLATCARLKRNPTTFGPDGPLLPSHADFKTADLFDLAAHARLEDPLIGGVDTAEEILRERAAGGELEAQIAVAALAGDERTVRRLQGPPKIDFSGGRGLMAIVHDLEAQLQGFAQHRTMFLEMAHAVVEGPQHGVDSNIIDEAARRLHEAARAGNDLAARLIATISEIQSYRAGSDARG
jgi:hypothetical protein